jgi:hypothetical protein
VVSVPVKQHGADRACTRAVAVILRFADLRKCVPPGKAKDNEARG